jgi:hypothetical protein
MANPKREIPENIPKPPDTAGGFSGDVTVAPVNGPSALDTQPDARPGAPPTAPPDPPVDPKANNKKK